MKLSAALLIYELRKYEPALVIDYSVVWEEHAGLSGIRILCDEPYKPDVLYLASSGDVVGLGRLPAHLFLAGRAGAEKVDGAVYIDRPLTELINTIEDIYYRYNQIDSTLTTAIARNEPLKTILSICAQFFNNPITINDLRMRFIEMSDNAVYDQMPEYFKVVLDTGYIDMRIMIAMKNRGYDRLINSTSETLLFELDEIPVRYFSKNIYEGSRITACLVVHEVFSPVDLAQTILVEYVTSVVDNYAFKNPRGKQTSVNKLEQVIRTLLDGTKYSEEIHALYLRQLNWGVEDGYYIIKVQVSAENTSMNTAQYTFASAQSFFPGSVIVENADNAVIVICAAQLRYDFSAALHNLEAYIEERHDKAAVSRKFQSFDAVYEQHKALTMAMRLGIELDPRRSLYHFSDYSLPLLLQTCGREFDLRVFCRPEAVALHAYDKANGSDFFKSLYVYLSHNRSLSAAADELKIHRNTLLYRLGRVTELTGLDPSAKELLLPLLLSFNILHYRR